MTDYSKNMRKGTISFFKFKIPLIKNCYMFITLSSECQSFLIDFKILCGRTLVPLND